MTTGQFFTPREQIIRNCVFGMFHDDTRTDSLVLLKTMIHPDLYDLLERSVTHAYRDHTRPIN